MSTEDDMHVIDIDSEDEDSPMQVIDSDSDSEDEDSPSEGEDPEVEPLIPIDDVDEEVVYMSQGGGRRRRRTSRGGRSSSWSSRAPNYTQRKRMRDRCGKRKCFLGPKLSFPICNKGTCSRSKLGVRAAYSRARMMQSKSRTRHRKRQYAHIASRAANVYKTINRQKRRRKSHRK